MVYAEPDTTILSWAARLKIAQRAAQGMSFFHQRNRPAYNSFDGKHILVNRVMYTAFDLLAFCTEKVTSISVFRLLYIFRILMLGFGIIK